MSIAPESTYGTFTETSQVFYPIISETLWQDVEQYSRKAEMTGNNRWGRKPVQGRIMPVRGTIKFYAYLDDIMGYMLRAALGDAVSSNLSGTAYKHVWYPGATQSDSLSIGVRRGGNTTEFRYAGCKVVSLKFNLNSGDLMTCEADIVGQLYTTGDTDAVSGLGTTIPPRFFEATIIDDAGSAMANIDWELTMDMGLNLDEASLFKFNQQHIIEPTAGGALMSVTGQISKNWTSDDDHADYTALRALTEKARVSNFITTQTISGGGGNVYRMNIETPKIIYSGMSGITPTASGVKKASIPFEAFEGTSANSNTTLIEFVLQNTATAYT